MCGGGGVEGGGRDRDGRVSGGGGRQSDWQRVEGRKTVGERSADRCGGEGGGTEMGVLVGGGGGRERERKRGRGADRDRDVEKEGRREGQRDWQRVEGRKTEGEGGADRCGGERGRQR